MGDAARPVPVRAVVRPDPRQHLPEPAAVDPLAGHRHLGRGRTRDRGSHRPASRTATSSAPRSAALSPDHQVVVALRYYRDLTVDDIARASASRSGRSSHASTTHSSACTTRSMRPTTRGQSDDRPRARGALRAWYGTEVGETETAPADLRESLATIPATTPAPLRPSPAVGALRSLRPPRSWSSAARWRRFRVHAPDGEVTPSPSADALGPSKRRRHPRRRHRPPPSGPAT